MKIEVENEETKDIECKEEDKVVESKKETEEVKRTKEAEEVERKKKVEVIELQKEAEDVERQKKESLEKKMIRSNSLDDNYTDEHRPSTRMKLNGSTENIANSMPGIWKERKKGKKECPLKPIEKEDKPLETLDPLMSREKKSMNHPPSRHKHRRRNRKYQKGIFPTIKRTQVNTQSKLLPKFLDPYQTLNVNVKSNDRYDLLKIAGEGPKHTSASADHMKPWRDDMASDSSSEADE